jgi:hypothetical protein
MQMQSRRNNGVRPALQKCPTPPVALARPLCCSAEVHAPLHPTDGCKTDKMSTIRLKACSNTTEPSALLRPGGRPVRGLLLGFSSTRQHGGPQGTFCFFCPVMHRGTAPGNVSPWSAAGGFCMTRHRFHSNSSPASKGPLGPR